MKNTMIKMAALIGSILIASCGQEMEVDEEQLMLNIDNFNAWIENNNDCRKDNCYKQYQEDIKEAAEMKEWGAIPAYSPEENLQGCLNQQEKWVDYKFSVLANMQEVFENTTEECVNALNNLSQAYLDNIVCDSPTTSYLQFNSLNNIEILYNKANYFCNAKIILISKL